MPRTIDQFSMQYDEDYVIDHRSGWSITINGRIIAELTTFDLAVRRLIEWLRGEDV